MKKQFHILLLILSLAMFVTHVAAQELKQESFIMEYRNNAIYLELGGPGLIYSLGYETTFYHTRRFSVIANMGAGYVPVSGGISGAYFQLGTLFHFGKSAIESGLAISYLYQGEEGGYSDGGSHLTTLTPRLGYRYTFNQSKCFVRSGITPLIIIDASHRDNGFQFWANVATFGFRF